MTKSDNHPYVFTGIQILSRALFEPLEVRKFSLRDIYFNERFEQHRKRIFGLVHTGEWLHIGTEEGIVEAKEALARVSL